MSMKLHGQCSFKLFSGFFLQLAYMPCFPIWRCKAKFNDLFDYISGHFISMLHISKLNMLFWAAVLWLSCCNNYCCVDRLLLL